MINDFLTFKSFVTPSILIICYYIGALGMPLFALYISRRPFWNSIKEYLPSKSWQWRLTILVIFLLSELAWRIFIEFFLAYFQIRQALIEGI